MRAPPLPPLCGAQGYAKVVVPLRDPLARVASGVRHWLTSKSKPWLHWNQVFKQAFGAAPAPAPASASASASASSSSVSDGQVNSAADAATAADAAATAAADEFVSALRLRSHPKHAAAMDTALGPLRAHFLLPVSQFYLAGTSGASASSSSSSPSSSSSSSSSYGAAATPPPPNRAEVAFVCADTLRDDFNALARRWRLAANMSGGDAGCIGCSRPERGDVGARGAVATGEVGVGGGGGGGGAAATQLRPLTQLWKPKPIFSEANEQWLRRLYAEDFELLRAHCR